MSERKPSFMEPAKAALVLRESLVRAGMQKGPLTIADAAAKSGLALRDAETALHGLTKEFRGHLRVSEEGDLVFLFPTGFTKPWVVEDALSRGLRKGLDALLGAVRFFVRAWVMIVLVVYAALFVAVFLALAFARGGDDDRRDRGMARGGEVLLRVLLEAAYWTFHPFSPVRMGYYESSWGPAPPSRMGVRRPEPPSVPFYERVNGFFFGPPAPVEDPRERERRILAEIRAQRGRIGLSDVLRITGLRRDEADPFMAGLLVDYEGDVTVSEEGGIVYQFPSLRRTASDGPQAGRRPEPVWEKPAVVPPLTGNPFETNALIVGLNFFNATMAGVVLEKGLTLDNLGYLLRGLPLSRLPPPDGVPLALGLVPLVISLGLLAFPIARALQLPFQERAVRRTNAYRAVLREVLTKVRAKEPVTERALQQAWGRAAGRAPSRGELEKVVVSLGGDVDLDAADEQGVRYRFVDLETEARALDDARREASDREARLGPTVFTSEDEEVAAEGESDENANRHLRSRS